MCQVYQCQKKGKTPVYQVEVVITQKDLSTLQELHQMAGIGNVYDGSSGRSRSSSWRLTHIQSREFLVVLLPYLRNKKKEAQLAIEFVDKFNRSTRNVHAPDTTAEKEQYRLELHNLKGISGATRGRPRQ